MRTLLRTLLLAIWFLLGTCSAAEGPTRFGLSADAYAAYQRWVLAMCIGGDEQTLAMDLARHAAELVPAFQRAIAEGPTDLELEQVRAAADALYERRAKLPLAQMQVTGVTRADLARFQRQSRAAFVQDQVKRFSTGYRANAIAALGLIGDANARAVLARIARDPRDPLAAAAREALRRREPR